MSMGYQGKVKDDQPPERGRTTAARMRREFNEGSDARNEQKRALLQIRSAASRFRRVWTLL